MSLLKVVSGFVPWILFSLVASREGPGAVTTAALLAFAVAAGLLVVAVVRGRSPKLLEVTGAVVFAGMGVVGALDPPADAFLTDYGRALATLILAVVIFVTLPVLPFTEQYARESVPARYWHSPVFRSVNRRISAAWGAVILGHAVCTTLAGTLPELGTALPTRPVDLALNWVVPLLLTWWAYRYTARVSAAAHDDATARAAQPAGQLAANTGRTR